MLALGGCAVALPSGPTVLAVPGPGRTLDSFQLDDLACRRYASASVNPAEAQAGSQAAVGNAIVGTGAGAALGALLGAATGSPATGAALGAGGGLLVGGSSGSSVAQSSAAGLQRQYNMAYIQCMVAKGNTVPSLTGPGVFPPPPPFRAF